MVNAPLLEKTRRKMETPRAAAIAGILFALLYGASLVLIRLSIPRDYTVARLCLAGYQLKDGFPGVEHGPLCRDRLPVVYRRDPRPARRLGRPLLCNRIPRQRFVVPGFDFHRRGVGRRIDQQLRN